MFEQNKRIKYKSLLQLIKKETIIIKISNLILMTILDLLNELFKQKKCFLENGLNIGAKKGN